MIGYGHHLSSDLHKILTVIRGAHRDNNGSGDFPALVGIRRLQGGLNNAVYACSLDGHSICIKIYRVDNRHRAEREWKALHFLGTHFPLLVPQPLWFDPDPEFPAVGMTLISGYPINQSQITPVVLHALADVLHQLFALAEDRQSYAHARVGAVTECTHRIEKWAAQIERTRDSEFVEFAHPLMQHWLRSNDRSILQVSTSPVFARGDPNLANCLWDESRLRLIDLEYAGWSDIAFECADLVEHINSRSISDEVWSDFVAQFIPSESVIYQRFRAAQRTCALLWIILLWPHRQDRTSTFLAQVERVQRLQRTDV